MEDKAKELIPAFIMSAYQLWKILGRPEDVYYPASSKKKGVIHENRILAVQQTRLMAVSNIFEHIDG